MVSRADAGILLARSAIDRDARGQALGKRAVPIGVDRRRHGGELGRRVERAGEIVGEQAERRHRARAGTGADGQAPASRAPTPSISALVIGSRRTMTT